MRIDGKKNMVVGLNIRLTHSDAFLFHFFKDPDIVLLRNNYSTHCQLPCLSFLIPNWSVLNFRCQTSCRDISRSPGCLPRSPCHAPHSCQSRPGIYQPPCHSSSATGITRPSHVNWQFCLLPRQKPILMIKWDRQGKVLEKVRRPRQFKWTSPKSGWSGSRWSPQPEHLA